MHPITSNEAKKLIQVTDGEAWTTSLIIAEQFGRRHKNVLQSLDDLIADGTLDRGLEIEPTMRPVAGPNGAVRQERAYRLSKRAALISMPFIGGKKSREGQKRLVDAFLTMEHLLKQQDSYRKTSEWLESRANGKVVRLHFTDGIQDFVSYATQQGSRNAQKYYMQLTKMEYQAIFMIDKAVGDGFRDRLNAAQLVNLATAELIAQRAIREGMEARLYYKDIYKLAKHKVETFASMVGKSFPGERLLRLKNAA